MSKSIEVAVRLKDQFTNPLKALTSNLQNSARQYERLGRAVQKAGGNIQRVGGTLTKTLTAPIVGAGVACVKTASDFQAGMSEVQSILQLTGEDGAKQMDQLKNKALEMGAKTKFSAKESASAFKYMGMAGWKTGQMMQGIEPIMKLAGATNTDLATTSDIVTDAITAFGLKAKDTAMFTDVLAQTATNTNTDVLKMGETFKYVAPTAGALGFNVKDVSVAMGLMANAGIKASRGGTSLRSLFTNLAKPTDAVEGAMSKLGISMTKSDGTMKSLGRITQELRSAFAGLTEKEKAQYAATLAGKTGMDGMLAIVNASEKDFNKLTKSIDKSTGSASDMYDIANDNLQGSLTVLKSQVETLAIAFGERLTPYVKKATDKIIILTEKFSNLSDEQKDTIVKIALIVATVGPAILAFGKLTSSVGMCISTIGGIGRALSTATPLLSILGGVAGGPIVLGSVIALAGAGILLYKNWDKVKPVIKSVTKFLKPVAKPMKDIKDEVKKLTGSAKKNFPQFKSMAKTAFGPTVKNLESMRDSMKDVAKVVRKELIKCLEKAKPMIKKFGDAISALAPIVMAIISVWAYLRSTVLVVVVEIVKCVAINFVQTVSQYIQNLITVFGGICDFISGVFTGNWKKAWNGIVSIFKGIFGNIVLFAKTPLNEVISMINGVIGGLNKIKMPDWVPKMGGKGINIPTIPKLATGTSNWQGGIVQISERGGEIVDLPSGSRVYPHDESVKRAYKDGARTNGSVTVSLAKIADTIIVREESDIDKIAKKVTHELAKKLEKKSDNLGDDDLEYSY